MCVSLTPIKINERLPWKEIKSGELYLWSACTKVRATTVVKKHKGVYCLVYISSVVSFTRQLTQSLWLYCSGMEEEEICLILLLSPKSSHHPVQITINMSRKATFAQHECVCRLAAPCSYNNLLQVSTQSALSLVPSLKHIHTLHYSHINNKAQISPSKNRRCFSLCPPVVTTSTHT